MLPSELLRLRVPAKTGYGKYREDTCVYSELTMSEDDLAAKPKCPWQVLSSCDRCDGDPGYTSVRDSVEALAGIEF